jgi:hypothetical protein
VRNLLLLRHRSPPLEYVAADEEATNPATVAEADELCEATDGRGLAGRWRVPARGDHDESGVSSS